MATRFTLGHGLALSVGLHLAPVAAYMAPWPGPTPPQMQRLELDLQGLISDEQQVARSVAAQPPPPPSAPPQQEQPAAVEPPPPDTPEPRPKEKPVPRPPSPKQEAPARRASVSAALAPPTPTAPPTVETTASGPQEEKRLRTDLKAEQFRYIAALVKRLKMELTFPDEAKGLGLLGRVSTLVAFTVATTGEISPASVRVVRSSGFPMLDARAAATIVAASPVEAPPMEMTVTVPLEFMQQQ